MTRICSTEIRFDGHYPDRRDAENRTSIAPQPALWQ
jgi:hypothetical protein